MGRINETFDAARRSGRGVVMPFITGGDPSMQATVELLGALGRAGAGAVEIGIPFSDPIADGPVIAASMHEALQRGVTPQAIFEALRGHVGARSERSVGREAARQPGALSRDHSAAASPPTVAMVSISIVHRVGVDRFIDRLAEVGLDGIIVPDADLASAGGIAARCDRHDLACAFLVAPTSKPDRVRAIVDLCRGFVYLLARAGITGESQPARPNPNPNPNRNPTPTPAIGSPAPGTTMTGSSTGTTTAGTTTPTNASQPPLRRQVDAIRAANPTIPIAAGFGIATPEHVRATLAEVDGAIVGSALVRRIQEAVRAGRDPIAEAESFVRSLVEAASAVRRA